MIKGVKKSPLKIISMNDGDVMHGMKNNDLGFSDFGEAYFSTISYNAIKGWKRHKEMVLNLIVPIGSVRFILYDDRKKQNKANQFQEVLLSSNNDYARLTIPPMIWMGFQGLTEQTSIVLNIANIEHSPKEIERKHLDEIKFNWSKY